MRLVGFFLLSFLLHVAALVHPFSLSERRDAELIQVHILSVEPDGVEARGKPGSANHAPRSDGKPDGARPPAAITRVESKTFAKTALPQSLHAEMAATVSEANVVSSALAEAPAMGPPSFFPTNDSETGFSRAIAGDGSGPGSSSSGIGSLGSANGIGNGSGSGTGVGLTLARPSEMHRPVYPESARREGREGSVLLRVLIDDQGRSKQVEVNHSSGSDALDRAAAEAIKRWRFHPARHGQNPVESWVRIPIEFRLAGPNSR